jgi:hypothetical protein
MAMPCLAAAETVSEGKKSNHKKFTSPKGSILWMFSLSEPPMWDGKYGNRRGNSEGLIMPDCSLTNCRNIDSASYFTGSDADRGDDLYGYGLRP